MSFSSLLALVGALLVAGCGREAADFPAPSSPQATPPDGAALYAQHCAACHMDDGSGVPNLQPSLRGSAIVAGDETLLIRTILRGPTAVLPPERERYGNTMPDFFVLEDAQIAAVLNHVRHRFGGLNGDITAASVAASRSAPESRY